MKRHKILSPLVLPMSFVYLVLLLFALMASCRSTKSITKETKIEKKSDSVISKETVKLDTFKVAQQTASLTIPFHLFRDSMLNYMEKSNGRAKVVIQRVGETIQVEAKCDSLEKIIASTNKELRTWQEYALQQNKAQTIVKIDVPLWFKLLLIGFVVLAILSFLKPFLFPGLPRISIGNPKSNSINTELIAEEIQKYLQSTKTNL